MPQSPPTDESAQLSRLWWLPLAFVIGTLLVLAVVPIAVEQRVRSVRNGVVAASDRSRVLLNDLEEAIAADVLQPDSSGPQNASTRQTAVRLVAVDADSLELVVHGVDLETSQRFEHLRGLLARWTAESLGDSTTHGSLATTRAILATADSLDVHLMAVSETQRAAVRRLERLDVLSAIVLVPLALVAIGVVMWGGQRVVHFARVAEHERAEVVRSTESRAALLRGVTHDLKNPLGAAAGYAHLLEEGVVGTLTPKQLDMVRRIQRLVDTSVQTISDLLDLARADGGWMHIERVDVDLAAIAREVVEDHRGLARDRGLVLKFDAAPAPVVTDPARVRQVLANSLSNAIKYTPSGGAISVSIVREIGAAATSRVGVDVRDTGPGIPAELRERVFEEYFRADRTSPDGHGLGLAISRRIARLLGGDVSYTPGAPSGAVFTLWLGSTIASKTGAAAPRDPGLSGTWRQ